MPTQNGSQRIDKIGERAIETLIDDPPLSVAASKLHMNEGQVLGRN